MDYKTMLIKFLEEKNVLVRQHTKLNIVTAPDFREIKTKWPEFACERVLLNLNTTTDAGICPWCWYYECSECTYAKRNGPCAGTETRYKRIVRRLPNSLGITNIPGMKELAAKYMEIVRRKVANE